eukprot:scaffold984_cov281-Chaetoceros_neogracile.AAC.22
MDEEINVHFPNGDIIFCYGSGVMSIEYYDDDVYYGNGDGRVMAAGVGNLNLGKAFPIPDDPFD